MTIELWLRAAELPQPSDPSTSAHGVPFDLGAIRPILAFGAPTAAERGLVRSGCDEGQYALLVAQQGAELRVEIGAALRGRHGIYSCLQVQADSLPAAEGEEYGEAIFRTPEDDTLLGAAGATGPTQKLYHLAIVLAPAQPLRLYLNGDSLESIYLADSDFDGRLPITPQCVSWGRTVDPDQLRSDSVAGIRLGRWNQTGRQARERSRCGGSPEG